MKEKTQLGFYLWAYNNVESVDYILSKMRLSYPDAELIISSDNGADMSNLSDKHGAIKYIHGSTSHGPCHDSREVPGRYGWTVTEARLWLDRLYEACKNMTSNYVMLMEEDVLVKERFRFIDVDILMIPHFKNPIGTAGLDWIKSRGGDCKYTYYSCGGGSIIKRNTFINAYETHINSFTENYERIYQEVMKENATGWGWNDSIICVLMYPENPTVSQQLPVIESGNENDPAPIIHNFKKYYNKNLVKKDKDVVLYYHAYLDGNFKSIVQDQLTKTFTSGLYKKIKRLELRCASPIEENYVWLENLVKDYSKINIQRIEINKDDYPANYRESKITLQQLSEDAKQNDAIYGYIHTKGVFNTGFVMDNWRLSMDWAVLVNWENCLTELGSADAVGPNLRFDTHVGRFPHFSGTYWWSSSDHIKTLDDSYLTDLTILSHNNHLLEEFWIGSNPRATLKTVFECGHNEPYLIETTINKYIKDEHYK